MYKREEIASILTQPLRVIMGSSYIKYKKTAESMTFLNKAIRSMSRRELLATVGYLALKYGIVEQPIPQNQQKGVESDKKEANRNKTQNSIQERDNNTQTRISTATRMVGCRLG